MIDLDAVEARAAAATPGEWFCDTAKWDEHDTSSPDLVCSRQSGGDNVALIYTPDPVTDTITPEQARANQRHIAGMDPETTLDLAAELRAAREAVKALRGVRAQVKNLLDDGTVKPPSAVQVLRGAHADLDVAVAACDKAVADGP